MPKTVRKFIIFDDVKWYYSDGSYMKSSKYGYLHRYIYSKFMKIPKGYVVHHWNEDKFDNKIENLFCMHKSEHMKIHSTNREMKDDTKKKLSVIMTKRQFGCRNFYKGKHMPEDMRKSAYSSRTKYKDGDSWTTKSGRRFVKKGEINCEIGKKEFEKYRDK